MCGISGVARAEAESPIPEQTLARMRQSLAHRGPDGSGVHVADGVGLVHTRLSIIDVGGGQQPLSNEDGSVWVTFNGEIYNFLPLRAMLEQRGHQFRTGSDTEVLVHLYEQYGPDLVRHLNGMFAFAIHDMRRRRVVLGRDHFGIKPLFYAVEDGTLVFGSEIKSVLAGLDRGARTTTEALQEYLLFSCVGDDRSFFQGVRRLPPGSVAVWEAGALTLQSYWVPPAPTPHAGMHFDEAVDALEAHLEAAVQRQLMSEVPLGTFCSGGVDSGLTSVYAARHSHAALHTFSVGFRDRAWDETALARDTARRIGSQHHVLDADPESFIAALPGVIWNHDEPLGHPNSVLIALLSQFARQWVTVVLTGEGADELFAGYPRHHIIGVSAFAQHFPQFVRRGAAAAMTHLGGRRGEMLAAGATVSLAEAIVRNSSMLSAPLVERITGQSPRDAILQRVAAAESLSVHQDPIASISRYDQRFYLPGLLDRMDRLTMSSGLEARVPFLDVPLAEWASTVPSDFKLGRTQNKRVVKRLAERYLSPAITRGAKSGFGVPIGDWLKTPAWRGIMDRLLDPTHPATTSVDGTVVRSLVSDHLAGRADHADALWLLTNVYLWHETRFDH